MFYKDRPTIAKEISYPKTVMVQDALLGKKVVKTGPTTIQKYHGYKLRQDHVKLSQEVTFCTNFHVDFLQSAR